MAWELGGEYEDHYGRGVEGGQMRDFGFSLGCSSLVRFRARAVLPGGSEASGRTKTASGARRAFHAGWVSQVEAVEVVEAVVENKRKCDEGSRAGRVQGRGGLRFVDEREKVFFSPELLCSHALYADLD